MTKYRLKKDTPDHRAGEIFGEGTGGLFSLDPNWEDTEHVFIKDNIEDFDEWFEEVKESGWWKPKFGEEYYFVSNIGSVQLDPWGNDELDELRYSMGNCFKTKDTAERYRDYLKAITTVRRDEGVLTTKEAHEQCDNGNRGYCLMPTGTVHNTISIVAPGGIYFKDAESAGASWDAHYKEWQTIINYDWSRE